jgi:hypothetical protein
MLRMTTSSGRSPEPAAIPMMRSCAGSFYHDGPIYRITQVNELRRLVSGYRITK